MHKHTNYAAIVACLGGFGIALSAVAVIVLAAGGESAVAAVALVVAGVLFAAMGVSLGLARRSQESR